MIHPNIICHKLAIYAQAKLVSQKKRKMGEERRKTIKEEVDKLLHANFIREVRFSTWLANIVMVKKANSKWRICTDYTDMNRACSKDTYHLPNINRLVDGTSGFQVLSFLDAYPGYNKTRMHPPDLTTMSSTYTSTFHSISCLKTQSISSWYVVPAFFRPNGMTL